MGVGSHIIKVGDRCEIMFGFFFFFTQIYNDRRLFVGGGPGVVPSDSYGSIAPSGQSADRRSGRGRGMLFLLPSPFPPPPHELF